MFIASIYRNDKMNRSPCNTMKYKLISVVGRQQQERQSLLFTWKIAQYAVVYVKVCFVRTFVQLLATNTSRR